jgi:hypothetical protein
MRWSGCVDDLIWETDKYPSSSQIRDGDAVNLKAPLGACLVHEQKRGQFVIYSIAADNLTSALYGFLSPFCPQARKIAAQRQRERKAK